MSVWSSFHTININTLRPTVIWHKLKQYCWEMLDEEQPRGDFWLQALILLNFHLPVVLILYLSRLLIVSAHTEKSKPIKSFSNSHDLTAGAVTERAHLTTLFASWQNDMLFQREATARDSSCEFPTCAVTLRRTSKPDFAHVGPSFQSYVVLW